MPLNSIPSTTSVGALEVKIKAARYGWENWKSLEEAQKMLGGDAGGNLDLKSGIGIGAGWGEGRVGEQEMHEHENSSGTIGVDEALVNETKMLDEGDEAMARSHGDNPELVKRLRRRDSRSKERLLDILGPADSFVGENKGVYCDVGFWGGLVPGNKVSHYTAKLSSSYLSAQPRSLTFPGPPESSASGRRQGFQVFPNGIRCRCEFSPDRNGAPFMLMTPRQEFPAVSEDDVRQAMVALRVSYGSSARQTRMLDDLRCSPGFRRPDLIPRRDGRAGSRLGR